MSKGDSRVLDPSVAFVDVAGLAACVENDCVERGVIEVIEVIEVLEVLEVLKIL